MARVENEQDLLLRKRARRRLVGSVVLVIIAIIVFPMILERAPKQEGKEIEIIIPSENLPEESSAVVAPEGSVPDTVPASINATTGSGIPGTESNTSKEVITEAEQITEKKADLLTKPVQKKKEQAGRVVGSKGDSENNHKDKKSIVTIEKFVVQLGAFSDSTKAKHQQRSLTSNGIKKAYTETIKNKNTEVTRVRIGPFSTREAAEKEQKKLRKLGINGVVMSK
jgi:DedD protein